jgi:signal transduction histidine kinase
LKRNKPRGFPIYTALLAADVIAAAICAVACICEISSAEPVLSAALYIPVLLIGSAGGSLLISLSVSGRQDTANGELSALKERSDKMEKTVRGLRNEAERREEFIASFTHELKTPLTAIIGYADMLRSKEMAPKPRFTAAGYIFSEGKRLEALSLKLMDIIVAGKQGFETKRFDCNYFLMEVAAVTIPSVVSDGITLSVHCERGETELEPDLFKTLMINLVDNARKASRKGSSIELLGKNENGGFAFYVADHGRGIKKEELGKITEPFYMADKSRARAQNGAGLGLALCKRIAELHGSVLEYDSEPGRGPTVRVFLRGAETT